MLPRSLVANLVGLVGSPQKVRGHASRYRFVRELASSGVVPCTYVAAGRAGISGLCNPLMHNPFVYRPCSRSTPCPNNSTLERCNNIKPKLQASRCPTCFLTTPSSAAIHTFLIPNNPRLSAVSFSPTALAGSEIISHVRSWNGVILTSAGPLIPAPAGQPRCCAADAAPPDP